MKRQIIFLICLVIGIPILLGSCALLQPLPKPATTQQRIQSLESIPTPQLQGKVDVYWDQHMVPFVHAENDPDAAFMLGMIQSHLRLSQMEFGKRVVYGRISEMIGPFTNDIDAAIKALNPTKATDAVLQKMPTASKNWLQAFVDGINHYKQHLPDLPHTMKVLNMRNEPWSMQDSLALGRLGGIDINWGVIANLLPEYGNDNWPATWGRVEQSQTGSTPSFNASAVNNAPQISANQQQKLMLLGRFLGAYARTGSNSFAISGDKSESGAPIIANDPHLGFVVPNLWMIAGLKSPSYHLVGMMAIGTPVFAFGRNAHIAWGGTNMRQEASDWVDITGLDDELIEQQHVIANRFWLDSGSSNRVHQHYGPVISDVDILPFPEGRDIAIRWTGHLPSDEVTAMLGISKAANWQEMLQAANGFSLPGQNFVFATVDGDIGQILATWVPKRPNAFPGDLFVTPAQSDAAWQNLMTAEKLPYIINPASGTIASANNKPYDQGETRISWFFPVDDRIKRLYQLMDDQGKISLQAMQKFQRDSYSTSHKQLHSFLLGLAESLPLSKQASQVIDAWRGWDGYFNIDSREAYLYHISYLALADVLYEQLPNKGGRDLFRSSGFTAYFIEQDLQTLNQQQQAQVFNQAFAQIADKLQDAKTWGDIHRLQVQHVLGNVPLLGNRYYIRDIPAPGHDATVLKTSGKLTAEAHNASYGSQSRHVSDLSDINANYFVLFGGQDGQINAANMLDQVPLWQRGEFIQVPFDIAQVRQKFTYKTVFD